MKTISTLLAALATASALFAAPGSDAVPQRNRVAVAHMVRLCARNTTAAIGNRRNKNRWRHGFPCHFHRRMFLGLRTVAKNTNKARMP
ncbi:MAG: hypothetical protein HZC23_08545 [Rhodocyclales bacterium]|nr:hypothetical protein [Rhodocyclales bacterium]